MLHRSALGLTVLSVALAGAAHAAGALPLSLTSSDGTGLVLTGYRARAVVEDPLAFTELHLVFRNPQSRAIEGQFEITLPPGATVSRFAMKQGSGWQEGEVVELQAARAAYEDFLHRRQDPALLEKQAGNQFRARVFPIPASSDKEIILSYSQELVRVEEPYRLPLRGLPRIDSLDIQVLVGKRELAVAPTTLGGMTMAHEVVQVSRRDFVPDVDFEVALRPADGGLRLGLRHENLAVARITPITEAAPDRVASLLVLVDTSASRALGFAAGLERLRAVLAQVAAVSGAQTPIAVVAFDQSVEPIFDGPVSGFGERQVRQLIARRALGATDLGRALAWAAHPTGRKFARLLLVTDGVVSAGPSEGQELRQAVTALKPAGIERLDVLVTGGIRDEPTLRRLVTAGLPRDGVVVDEAHAPAAVALKLSTATFSGIKVSVAGAKWVWPTQLDGVQPGDQVLVYADLPPSQSLEVTLAGAYAGRCAVRLAPVQRPLLERAWVSARIRRLEHQRETLATEDAAGRGALKKEIVELSTRFRVLCDHTALLVLETEADYARFHIDRRALSDILTVGAGGIELQHRPPPAQVALPPSSPPPPRTPVVEKPGFKAPVAGKQLAEPEKPEKADPATLKPSVADAERKPEPASAHASRAHVDPDGVTAPDIDHDGIPDAVDRCPSEPETFNGLEDEDGCPDRGRVILTQTQIQILDQIHFTRRSALLAPVRRPLLAAIAAALREHPQITRVEVQGNVDETEPPSLGEARARTVVAQLVLLGVEARRLQARGYGRTQPLCTEHDARCRERNRRVELRILSRSDDASSSPAIAPPLKSPYVGRFAEVMGAIKSGHAKAGLDAALAWRDAEPGDVLALIALGEAWEATGKRVAAARAYGSVIDLFPARADLRRFAGERLERLGPDGADLAIDTYQKARAQRPDHPASHRLTAFALLRAGRHAEAFQTLVDGVQQRYPGGRFLGVDRILREDLGLIAAAWARQEPARRIELEQRLTALGGELPRGRSLRFVLNWETDANDVDFHIHDGKGGHAFYSSKQLPSGGELYADVTTGYGPECFTIPGQPGAFPYKLQAHYYSRGPMGYGMGKLEVLEHDGEGRLSFDERPFVIQVDGAFIDLGTVDKSLPRH